MGINGTIFLYSPTANLCAFDSDVSNDSVIIFIHGITEGFLSIPLLPQLSKTLRDMEIASVVQIIMRSSYAGYGITSLDTDVEDLVHLLKELKLRGKTRAVICGHSTGTQDVIKLLLWLKDNRNDDILVVNGAVLLAPVSDREAFLTEISENLLKERVTEAETEVLENRGHKMTPREWGYENLPCSYKRFLSLSKRLGQEDMWSSDLTTEELSDVVGHVKIPTLVMYAGSDEYVPEFVDKSELLSRIKNVIPGCCKTIMVHGAKHEFESVVSQRIVITHIVEFVKKVFA